jgi:DNA recombination protein RmuC
MEIIYLIIGVLTGGLIAWLIQRTRINNLESGFQTRLTDAQRAMQEKINALDKEKSIFEEKFNTIHNTNLKITEDLISERKRCEVLNTQIARIETENKNLGENLEKQKIELESIQKKFTTEFENIANRILKQNSQEFTTVNQKNMGDLLNPLKEKIKSFEEKVENTYQKGIKDQTDLKAELKKLYDLNYKISEEANNLTRALKSDTKKQGNWGEVVLERVLERSGLVKGQEYKTQETARNEAGDMIRPDVVVYLPDNKHIIIDSKVSLIAYEAYSSEEDQTKREIYLKQHVDSIRNHVKSLGEKNYSNATLFDSPDFVLLFMPIESAFSAAIQADIELFNYAWEKKIVMVSPTTLLATLRTIASIWKHEKQTQNAMEIATQGGALYDKFVGFLKDMEDLGLQIGRVSKTYDETRRKLADGSGNIIKRVENLKKLGAKTTKSIPENFIDNNDL